MKTSKLFIYLALLCFLAPTVISCSDDDDMDIPGHTIPPKAGLVVGQDLVRGPDRGGVRTRSLRDAGLQRTARVEDRRHGHRAGRPAGICLCRSGNLRGRLFGPERLRRRPSSLHGGRFAGGQPRHHVLDRPAHVRTQHRRDGPAVGHADRHHGNPFVEGRQPGGLDLRTAGLFCRNGRHETHQAYADLRRGYDLHHAVHADGRPRAITATGSNGARAKTMSSA